MVFSVYTYYKIYITTVFQTSPVEKERNKPLYFKFQASSSKFQAETIASFRQILE